MKQYLYCSKCRRQPDLITETFLKPLKETWQWNGKAYELAETNADRVGSERVCGACGSKLKVKKPSTSRRGTSASRMAPTPDAKQPHRTKYFITSYDWKYLKEDGVLSLDEKRQLVYVR